MVPQSGDGIPAGLVFASEWNTATGNTTAAFRDSNRARPWTGNTGQFANGGSSAVRVTATDGRDFPTANYLRVTDEGNFLTFLGSDAYYTTPAVGEWIYFRIYHRLTIGNTAGNAHGLYWDDSPTVPNWGPNIAGIYVENFSASTFSLRMSAHPSATRRYYSPAGASGTPEFLLDKNVTYRFELGVNRTATTTYEMAARLYNIAGTLLYDTADFNSRPYYGLPSDPLTGEVFTVTAGAFDSLTGYQLGKEGPEGTGGDFAEYAGMAISSGPNATWLGAYRSGEATWSP